MLTDTRVRGVKSTQRPQKLTDARGLYLLVTPSGGRYWRFDYSFNGKRKTLAFGVYPDVRIGKARERHYEARQQLAEGIDPGVVQQCRQPGFRGRSPCMVGSLAHGAERALCGLCHRPTRSGCVPADRLAAAFRNWPLQTFAMWRGRSSGAVPRRSPGGSCRTAARSCATPWRTIWPSATPCRGYQAGRYPEAPQEAQLSARRLPRSCRSSCTLSMAMQAVSTRAWRCNSWR